MIPATFWKKVFLLVKKLCNVTPKKLPEWPVPQTSRKHLCSIERWLQFQNMVYKMVTVKSCLKLFFILGKIFKKCGTFLPFLVSVFLTSVPHTRMCLDYRGRCHHTEITTNQIQLSETDRHIYGAKHSLSVSFLWLFFFRFFVFESCSHHADIRHHFCLWLHVAHLEYLQLLGIDRICISCTGPNNMENIFASKKNPKKQQTSKEIAIGGWKFTDVVHGDVACWALLVFDCLVISYLMLHLSLLLLFNIFSHL